MSPGLLPRLAFIGLLSLLVAGCAYDYMQHTDKVGYSAGDAVHANMAIQTTNPYKPGSRSTDGLGKNGGVITPSTDGSASATPSN